MPIRMNVLHLISSSGLYGAESALLNLANAQRSLGLKTTIGIFKNKRAPHTEIERAAQAGGSEVQIFPSHGRFDRATLQSIQTFIQEQSISLVHCHGYKSNFYGYFAAKHTGVPFVSTCHLWTGATLSVRLYEFIDSLVLRRADKVIGVSDKIVHALAQSGIPQEKLAVIGNGVDLMPYQGA